MTAFLGRRLHNNNYDGSSQQDHKDKRLTLSFNVVPYDGRSCSRLTGALGCGKAQTRRANLTFVVATLLSAKFEFFSICKKTYKLFQGMHLIPDCF